MTKCEQIQQQIDALTNQSYDWATAPVICELNGYRWILGPEAPEMVDWDAAIEWCQTVGGELPPRNILSEAYLNNEIRKEFTTAGYWSSTELTGPKHWVQFFIIGGQSRNLETNALYVRAVRGLDI
jgi:hypothetical protein